MRYLLFLLLLISSVTYSQSNVDFRGDSARFYKNGGSMEVVIRNSTKDSTNGILVNTGNGVTSFLKLRVSNDSLFLGNTFISLIGSSGNDSTYINFDLPSGYIIVDGDTTDVNVVQYMNDSLIRNQYASREAKRLWVDTARASYLISDSSIIQSSSTYGAPFLKIRVPFIYGDDGFPQDFKISSKIGDGYSLPIHYMEFNQSINGLNAGYVFKGDNSTTLLRMLSNYEGGGVPGIGTSAFINVDNNFLRLQGGSASMLLYPAGTTAQRPSVSSFNYYFRFNTDSTRFEGYNGTTWRGIAWTGEGGSGSYDPANVILNQYASREAKRLWVDTAYGRMLRADTFATNTIPSQYSLIFNNGRLTGARNVQNNLVGMRFFQRTAAEGYVASDLILRGADSSGSNQTYSVRWDGRTTIGTGTTTNLLDAYGSAGGFNNTNIRVKTTAANGDARLISENSGTGRVFLQATSSSASILANQGSLLVENLPKFEFMTDGQLTSGGTSPFYFKAGGYTVNPQLGIFPSNQVSVNMGSTTPNAALIFDIGGSTRATRPYSQLTTTQMNAISSPPAGATVYNTTENAVMTFDGTRWTGFRYNGTKFQGYESGSGTWVDLN